MIKKILTGLTAALAVALPPVSAQEMKEINFGIIATESTTHLRETWQPVLDDMEKKTGLKVKAFFASDYAGVIEALRFNKVQVAWMGNKAAIDAIDRASSEVFAQMTYADGAPGYWSLLITHKDSPYKTLDDVLKRGKEINYGAGDPQSTSGTLVPSYYLFAANKIDARTHFKSFRSANHEANLLAVINKQVDVAINNTEAMDRYALRDAEKVKNVRILWKSPLIAADPIMWRTDLAADVKAKVKNFFMTYARGNSPEARAELAKLGKMTLGPFKESSNAQITPFRQLELFKEKAKLTADDKTDPKEKAHKLADIDKKLAALSRAQ